MKTKPQKLLKCVYCGKRKKTYLIYTVQGWNNICEDCSGFEKSLKRIFKTARQIVKSLKKASKPE